MVEKMSKAQIVRRANRLTCKAREIERNGKCADKLWDEIACLNERLAIMMEFEAQVVY